MQYDYEIIHEINRGAYGIVYKVKSNNQIMVLKSIDLQNLTYKQQNEAYKEVAIMSKLNHPNVINYYNSHLHLNKLLILMEQADCDLYTHVRNQPDIKENEVWNWASQILEGLEYLHSMNIIHRDIKPNNILLKGSVLKISDLGVSKMSNNQLATSRVGTPLYLAPELIRNKPYNKKIDIWALGCVLYFVCQKQPPFSGNNLISLGYNIINRPARPIDAKYSRKLQNLINKMLNKLPEFRPSATECLGIIREQKGCLSDYLRVKKILSVHSQIDVKVDQSYYFESVQQRRLQRIISNQKEAKERVNNVSRFDKIILQNKYRKHQSEHYEEL